ncbi:MAG: phage tail tape measure protein [Oligoflexales bacterium]
MNNLVQVTIGGSVASTLKSSLSSTESAVKAFGSQVRAANRTIGDIGTYKNLRTQILGTVTDLRSAKTTMASLSGVTGEQQTRLAELEARIKQERKSLAASTAIHRDRKSSLKFLGDEIKSLEAKYKATSAQLDNSTDKSTQMLRQLEDEAKALGELRQRYKDRFLRLKENKQQLDEQKSKVKQSNDQLKEHKTQLALLQRDQQKASRSVHTLNRTYLQQKETLGGVKTSLNRAGIAVRSLASEELRLARAAQQANDRLKVAQKWDSIRARNRRTFDSAPGQIMSTAYAAMQVGAPIIAASSFESSQSGLRALTDPGKESEVAMLSQRAMALGRDSSLKYSATKIMDSMKYMKMAGTSTGDINKSISDVLKMAMAGEVEASYAADIGTNIMSAFGLEGGQSMKAVGNILTKAFTSHNLTLPKIAETMKYVGPLAGMLKVKEGDELGILSKMSAMAGILGNKGIDSSTAGTGLRKIITSMAAPTGAARDYLSRTGIETVDESGNLKSLDELFVQLSTAMENDGTAEKADILKTLFGEEALSSASALTEAAKSGKLKESIDLINNYSGAMDRIAQIKMDNVIGAFENLKASAVGASIEIGKTFLPVIRFTLDTLRVGANTIATLAKTFPTLTFVVAATGTAITGLKVATLSYNIVRAVFSGGLMSASRALYFMTGIQLGASKVTKAHTLTTVVHSAVVRSLTFTYGLFWKAVALYSAVTSGSITVTGLFSKALMLLRGAFMTNPLGLIVVGIGAAVTYAYNKSEWFREKIKGLWEWFKGIGGSIMEFFGLIDSKVAGTMSAAAAKAPELVMSTALAASSVAAAPQEVYELPKPQPMEQRISQKSEYAITINISGADSKKATEIKDEVEDLITKKFAEIERKRRIDDRRKLMDRSKGGMF